jgi:DNA-binding ferritin-like protein
MLLSRLFLEAGEKDCDLVFAAEAVEQALAAQVWLIRAQVACNGHAAFADAFKKCEKSIDACGEKLNSLQSHPVFGGQNYLAAKQAWQHVKSILVKSNRTIAQTAEQLRREAEERGELG